MLSLERDQTAVLIMDYQTNIVRHLETPQEPLLQRASRVVQEARGAKIPVIYVVVGFRMGYPEVSPRNSRFAGIRETGVLRPMRPVPRCIQQLPLKTETSRSSSTA